MNGAVGIFTDGTIGEAQSPPILLVVGNGPAGVHLVNQLLKHGWPGRIRIFGEEEYEPYNRVLLSAFLNREINYRQIQNPIKAPPGKVEQICARVDRIDAAAKRVLDSTGAWHAYDRLVLATGSRPHIPQLHNRGLKGIYRFRDLRDASSLFARLSRTRNTIVLGGGLLGLETARAMSRQATRVTVVQHSPILMNRQLDEEASRRIQAFAEAEGIAFRFNLSVKEIRGSERIEALLLSSGEILPCDTLIFATGIVPNKELALEARLSVGLGIRIDEQLRTSDPHIHAIGECAEYAAQVFGLVAPGLEQASVLAANLTGQDRRYRGSTAAAELKVLGLEVFSGGCVDEPPSISVHDTWRFSAENRYRRVFLHKGRMVGAIAVGAWPELKAVQEAIRERRRLRPWRKWRFQRTGLLFKANEGAERALPDRTIICNCQQVSLGQIKACLARGGGLPAVQADLGAGTLCGSCMPLLQRILHVPVDKQPVRKGLLYPALLSVLMVAAMLWVPPPPAPASVQDFNLAWLWTDGPARQSSGFSALGLTAVSLALSLRKRMARFRWAPFDAWRHLHVVLAALALLTLFVHTGVSLGEGLNRWLIVNFLLLALLGGAVAFAAALEGKWLDLRLKALKRHLAFCHILAFWPLPVLLGFHILSVYYF